MKKLLPLLLCAILAGCGPIGFNVKVENKTFVDASYDGVTEIRIEQAALPVRIVKDTSGKTHVKCFVERMTVNRKQFRITARQEGSVLEIRQLPRQGLSVRGKVDGYIDVSVPQGVKEVFVSSVSGDVKACGLSLEKLDVRTVSGDITVDSISVESLLAKSVSGEVTADSVRGAEISATTVSGDVRAKGLGFSSIDMHTVSGDLSLLLAEGVAQLTVKTVSGDANLYFPGDLRDNSYRISGVSGRINIEGVARGSRILEMDPGKGLATIRVKTVSGDVKIANIPAEKPSEISSDDKI